MQLKRILFSVPPAPADMGPGAWLSRMWRASHWVAQVPGSRVCDARDGASHWADRVPGYK